MLGAAVFLFGMVVGSFLNVCILRIPAGQSVVTPRSRCQGCGKPIAAWDNIPVLSWIFLRGKCRHCKMAISALYPTVELLTGVLFCLCYLAFGPQLETAKWMIFSALLIVLTVTDLRERLLPDKVTLTGAALGLALSLAVPLRDGTALWLASRLFAFPPPVQVLSLADALLGAATGAGFLWIVAEVYFRVRGREGMGFGDVKLMGMAGTFLGLKGTLLTVLAGSLLGSVFGSAFILLRRKGSQYELPFGTFLGMAALLVLFFGPRVLGWYVARLP